MIFAKLDNWKDGFRHDGMLFFTQRVAEMLSHYSDHIYRTPVLNTISLLDEYFQTVSLIEDGSINEKHKQYILDELLDSLNNDIVVQKYLDKNECEKIIQKVNSSTNSERNTVLDYLRVKISNYDLWCRDYLKELVLGSKDKEKISKVLNSFIPGLISFGYDRDFIYHYNEKIFVQQDVTSIESLNKFFARFDYNNQEYDVYIPIVKELEKFRELFVSRIRDFEFVDKESFSDFKYKKNKYSLVKIHVKALEENSAAARAFNRLNVFFRYYKFLRNNSNPLTFPKGMVIDKSGEKFFLSLKKSSYSISTFLNSDEACKIADKLILTISKSSDNETVGSIAKVFDLHNTAIRTNNIKNGFLNFWSIVEIIFVNSNKQSKIENIEKNLIPILQIAFIQSLCRDLECKLNCNVGDKITEMKKNMGLREENSFVNAMLIEMSNEKIGDDIQKAHVKELNEILSDFPILRNRFNDIKKFFSTKENLRKELNRIKQRLEWHVIRLYRTRNSISHSGEDVSHLKDLGEHLHNYIDDFMIYILLNLPDLETIDNVILDCCFKYESIMTRIEGKDKLTVEDLNFIMKQAMI